MTFEFEECVREIIEAENASHGDIYDIAKLSRVEKPGFKSEILDSPDIYRLGGVRRRDNIILFVSNPDFPDIVSVAAKKTRAVVENIALGPGRHVLLPVSLSLHDGRSYALYPRLRALSKNKILRMLQVAAVKGDIFQWLSDVASGTQAYALSDTELSERFIAPYTYLLNEKRFSAAIRNQAASAIAGIDAGKFHPATVVQHGDFWHGNILLNNNNILWPNSFNSFSIIDWGGSNINGYPYIDLLRFSLSVRYRDASIVQKLARYNSSCMFSGEDLLNYVCAHAGYLGIDRGEFPFERYVRSMETLFATASRLAQ